MTRRFRFVAAVAIAACFPLAASVAESEPELKTLDWSFDGPFGAFDRAQLRRGYQVYHDVCSNCHSMQYMRYHNLGQKGGPEFSEDEVKALAEQIQVPDDPDEQGQPKEWRGRPSDTFPSPFPNEKAARAANNGALPPDLSLIAKAREGGPDYIHAILTGYADAPADMKMSEGMNYNKAFPGHQIAMPQPLADGAVQFTDGAATSLDQLATDVAAFLMWTAEPTLDERHVLGVRVMLFLIVLAGLTYAAKVRIWRRIKH